ncbi:MAG: hypothetical protein K2Z81_02865, partial [Cyanobacteria bacterium]|nr:hypothetical protein [Cyanobacteriota bacterium]
MPELDSLRSFTQTENWTDSEESVGSRLLRETQVISSGVGASFVDAAKNPVSRAPELLMAGGFGVGVRALSKAGAPGRLVAGAVGVGLFAKLVADEWTGDRWSRFGSALDMAWRSDQNLNSAIAATRDSVGSLAVDFTVASIGFGLSGRFLPESPLAARFENMRLRSATQSRSGAAAALSGELTSTATTASEVANATRARSGLSTVEPVRLQAARVLSEDAGAGSLRTGSVPPVEAVPSAASREVVVSQNPAHSLRVTSNPLEPPSAVATNPALAAEQTGAQSIVPPLESAPVTTSPVLAAEQAGARALIPPLESPPAVTTSAVLTAEQAGARPLTPPIESPPVGITPVLPEVV